MIKYSVITPVYNASRFLPQMIESVIGQTFGQFELILIDDKSTDSSVDIIKKYCKLDSRIKLFTLPYNNGPSAARNLGIRKSIGEYIVYIDADDLLVPESLEIRNKHIDINLDSLWFHGRVFLLKGNKKEPEKFFHQKWEKMKGQINHNYSKCVHAQSVTLSRKIFNIIGLFDTSLKFGEDQELWKRAIHFVGLPVYMNDFISIYRIHDKQVTKNKILKKEYKTMIKKLFNKRVKDGINSKNTELL